MQEFAARLVLDRQAFLGHEGVARVAAVVRQALGVPGGLRRALGGEEAARFIDVPQAEEAGAACERGREGILARRGQGVEFLLQRRRLDQDQLAGRVQVIRQAGARWIEPDARRGGEGDALDRRAGALGHRVELLDRLDLVAEEIEPVRLVGGHGVDVDDPAAHGVMPGCFAHRLGVVVEAVQFLQQAVKRLRLAAAEGEFALGEGFEGGHRLEQGGGGWSPRRRCRARWRDCAPPGAATAP